MDTITTNKRSKMKRKNRSFMNKNFDPSFVNLLKPALLTSILYLSVGWLLFLVVDQVRGAIKFNNLDIKFLLIAFIVGFIIAFVPVIVGTFLLGLWLYNDLLIQRLSAYKSIMKGMLIGGMTGFGISMFLWIFVTAISSRAPDFGVFIYRIVMVTILSLILGGGIGKNWFKWLTKIKREDK